ncbi:MAG: hypothetical protein AABX93_02105 [Nanoarchaeota archaeon]
MNKKLVMMFLSFLVIALSVLLISIFLLLGMDEFQPSRSYTKAICNENNLCEDYEIHCKGNSLVELSPTGFAVQFPKNQIDEMEKETIQKLC